MAQIVSKAQRHPMMFTFLVVLCSASWILPAAASERLSAPGARVDCRVQGVHRFTGFVRAPDGTITTFVAPDKCVTWPTGINSAGVVTGYVSKDNDNSRTFLRSTDGSITTIKLKGPYAEGLAINKSGAITGYEYGAGFVRDAQGNINYFYVGAATQGTGINDKGDVAGTYFDNDAYHAFFRRTDGKIFTFDGTEGAPNTYAYGINQSRQIVGTYWDSNDVFHGFIRNPDGTIITLDAPGAGTLYMEGTEAYALNDAGTVTGVYVNDDGLYHGFVRAPDGTYSSFDAQGNSYTVPNCINRNGYIGGDASSFSSGEHGFVRAPDGTITLFDATDKRKPSTGVTGINDDGEIVGSY
jgi:uncharacterized membrane protein